MRMIDGDALIDNICRYASPEMAWDRLDIVHKINEMPTIEERKGKWIQDEKSKRHRCDQCFSFALKTDDGQENLSDYCPVCGSAMEGG